MWAHRGSVILYTRAGAQRNIQRPTEASDATQEFMAPAALTFSHVPSLQPCVRAPPGFAGWPGTTL